MPTLEQKEDGDYFVRAYSHSKGCILTWQVRGSGLTYLNKRGIDTGNTFAAKLLKEMIDANHVFTGGSGVHLGSAGIQNRSFKSTTVPGRNTSSQSSPRLTNGPQKSQPHRQPAGTFAGKTISLVFRKYKKRWELLIVFPSVKIDESKWCLLRWLDVHLFIPSFASSFSSSLQPPFLLSKCLSMIAYN